MPITMTCERDGAVIYDEGVALPPLDVQVSARGVLTMILRGPAVGGENAPSTDVGMILCPACCEVVAADIAKLGGVAALATLGADVVAYKRDGRVPARVEG